MAEAEIPQFDSSLIGQRQQRIQKISKLRELGIDPFPAKSNRTHSAGDIIDSFETHENRAVTIAGRLASWREHGQLTFADLEDNSGKIQLYIKSDELEETNPSLQNLGYPDLNLFDVGDIVEAQGIVTKTQRGEVSILVHQLKILTKAIRPLPTELTEKEDRFRRRYVDMQLHPEVRERFARRAAFWQAIRDFLNQENFVEINTPVLEHVTGGADAKPFVTHLDALDQQLYLRISHELPLKRLIGGGYEKVFDIGPRFRNEGIDDEHLPEHVAMEWYWAYADWRDGMELTKRMFQSVLQKVYGTQRFSIRGFDVDLTKEWDEIDYTTIINNTFEIDIFTTPVQDLIRILHQNGVQLDGNTNRSRAVDNLWKLIRKDIAGPAFLVGVPKEFSPLAKSDSKNPNITQRFHPIIAGSELANAYSELNDPLDQLDRFLEQQSMRAGGDDEAQMLDIDFVEMLEYGMPPTVGFGLSERVFWFFENVSAKEGVPFPQLRSEVDDVTRKIYGEKVLGTMDIDGHSKTRDIEKQHPAMYDDASTKSANVQPSLAMFPHVSPMLPSRDKAVAFVEKYVQDEYQRHHALMVEIAMRAVARHLNQDEELFGLTGLVHDWDFDKWPTEHPGRFEILREELGVSEEVVNAIIGHKGVSAPRTTLLDKALFACDEFSGLLYAYMKMVGNYKDMKISSIAKKVHKDLSFAAKINREDVTTGIAELNIPEEEFFQIIRDAFSAAYD